ncbi:hypothetical protein [Streptomyces sp. NPDC086519]|uniref:hypothetical protein n=1 Tax=Streptomyces sp. NPDC086519 TaxID=3154863 RepID=UPI00342C7A95
MSKLARQPHYRWLERSVTYDVLEEAYRANTLFEAHREDPELGFLADETRDAGSVMADWTAWRICRGNHWWSVFGKRSGRPKKAGPPVRDDLVRRHFTMDGPNCLWLADITEHANEHSYPRSRAVCRSRRCPPRRPKGVSTPASSSSVRLRPRLAIDTPQ